MPRIPRRDARRRRALAACGALAGFVAGCIDTIQPPPPVSCDGVTPLFRTDAVLNDPQSPCYVWVASAAGRVGKTHNASTVVWSRRTAQGTGVLASAMHAFGAGLLADAGDDVEAALYDPLDSPPAPAARFRGIESDSLDDETPAFLVFNPFVPGDEHSYEFQQILPRHDFFIAAAGGASADATAALGEPLDIVDPGNDTTATPTFATAAPGDLILVLGFPGGSPFGGKQAASVGRILSDADAEQAILDLQVVGDEEGDIAYDAEAEYLLDGNALPGMSGCGAFDREGRLVGVLVRASDARDGKQIVRIVRMSFIVASLSDAIARAEPADVAAAEPFLESETP